MSKKAKLPTDVNSRAKAIVDFATSDEELPDPDEGKDPAAVALTGYANTPWRRSRSAIQRSASPRVR